MIFISVFALAKQRQPFLYLKPLSDVINGDVINGGVINGDVINGDVITYVVPQLSRAGAC